MTCAIFVLLSVKNGIPCGTFCHAFVSVQSRFSFLYVKRLPFTLRPWWGLVCWESTTVNPEYFVRTQFSYPGLSDLSYAWNFRTFAARCGFSDLLCTFRMHFIFVRKPPRTKCTKITCIRNILDLQYWIEVKIDVSEISKPPTGLSHPEKWQP